VSSIFFLLYIHTCHLRPYVLPTEKRKVPNKEKKKKKKSNQSSEPPLPTPRNPTSNQNILALRTKPPPLPIKPKMDPPFKDRANQLSDSMRVNPISSWIKNKIKHQKHQKHVKSIGSHHRTSTGKNKNKKQKQKLPRSLRVSPPSLRLLSTIAEASSDHQFQSINSFVHPTTDNGQRRLPQFKSKKKGEKKRTIRDQTFIPNMKQQQQQQQQIHKDTKRVP
jgi:hypothetical protein